MSPRKGGRQYCHIQRLQAARHGLIHFDSLSASIVDFPLTGFEDKKETCD